MAKYTNPSINTIVQAMHYERKSYDRNGNPTGWYKASDIYQFKSKEATIFIVSDHYVVSIPGNSSHRKIAERMNGLQAGSSFSERSVYAFQYFPTDVMGNNLLDIGYNDGDEALVRIDALQVGVTRLQQDIPDHIFAKLKDSDYFKVEEFAAKYFPDLYKNQKTRKKAWSLASKAMSEEEAKELENIELPVIEF